MSNDDDATISEMMLIARLAGDDDANWEQTIRAELRRSSFLVAYRLAMTAFPSLKDQPEATGGISAANLAEQRPLVGKYLTWVVEELVAVGIGSEIEKAE